MARKWLYPFKRIRGSGPEPPKLPLDAVTQTFAILGQRGTGKTNAGVVLAEEMMAAGGRVLVIDIVGAWWGLAHAGEGPGLPVIILGGEHGDVPLEHSAGRVIARTIVESSDPGFVLDLSEWRYQQQATFVADLLEELYRINREALHVMFEEADQLAPQNPREKGDVIRMLGAVERVIKLGRGHGLGGTLITQRAPSLNKTVLEECATLVALALLGTRARKAVKDWIEAAGDPKQEKIVMGQLARLEQGHAVLWSPRFLDYLGVVRWRKRKTFDSSYTPAVGEAAAVPGARRPVDLGELREAMAETVERAEANDPAKLRKRIRTLEEELSSAQGEMAILEPQIEEREVEVLVPNAEAIAQLGEAAEDIRSALKDAEELKLLLRQNTEWIDGRVDDLRKAVAIADEALDRARSLPSRQRVETTPARTPAAASPTARPAAPPARASSPSVAASSNGNLPESRQRILNVLATLGELGLLPADRTQVALFAGVSPKSSGFRNNLGGLRSDGYIDYPSKGTVEPTPEGEAAATPDDVPRRAVDLHPYVYRLVGESKAAVLRPLIDVYPEALDKGTLAERAGVSPDSSGYRNNLGALRSLGLLDYPRPGLVAALPVLFPDG